ncbi:hypothetical protein B0H17DRAFT_1260069 [Mycena rosella]|uniref:Uncharacterized protein n=1 Tax=Mycena rosella TaxID=1033263 RepID=A0AAD7GJX8_MYCRO|nr:hypothetical protein B0H17DRAFT_1260069 [Mycena rosella]
MTQAQTLGDSGIFTLDKSGNTSQYLSVVTFSNACNDGGPVFIQILSLVDQAAGYVSLTAAVIDCTTASFTGSGPWAAIAAADGFPPHTETFNIFCGKNLVFALGTAAGRQVLLPAWKNPDSTESSHVHPVIGANKKSRHAHGPARGARQHVLLATSNPATYSAFYSGAKVQQVVRIGPSAVLRSLLTAYSSTRRSSFDSNGAPPLRGYHKPWVFFHIAASKFSGFTSGFCCSATYPFRAKAQGRLSPNSHLIWVAANSSHLFYQDSISVIPRRKANTRNLRERHPAGCAPEETSYCAPRGHHWQILLCYRTVRLFSRSIRSGVPQMVKADRRHCKGFRWPRSLCMCSQEFKGTWLCGIREQYQNIE